MRSNDQAKGAELARLPLERRVGRQFLENGNMANLILYKDGAYNLYTTIADGACYESALTLEQLEEVIRFDHGEQGIRDLPARLERAHKTGCSSMHGETLEECISCNRAGPNETRLSVDEFVAKYLTLPPNCEASERR